MEKKEIKLKNFHHGGFVSIVGLIFVAIGILSIFQLYPAAFVLFVLLCVGSLVQGFYSKNLAIVISSAVLLVAALVGVILYLASQELETLQIVGIIVGACGLIWMIIFVITRIVTSRTLWWALIPAGLFIATALCFFFKNTGVLDFIFANSIGLGIALLTWGLCRRLLGLVIAGLIVASTGSGLFLAWGRNSNQALSGLARSGLMLVVFSMGWFLIVLFDRLLRHRFLWWPLIPGGVIGVVGLGLYIGGQPAQALTFLGNTGSIVLIFIGIYLLLVRWRKIS